MQRLFTYNKEKSQLIIGLKIKAGAKINQIGNFVEINEKSYLKLSIKAEPEDGKANKAIIDFLSLQWKIPKKDFEIIIGNTSSLKLLEIKNISQDYLNSILSNYIK